MPFYRYLCPSCSFEVRKFANVADRNRPFTCDKCQAPLKLALGTPNGQAVETTDEYRGIKIEQDLHRNTKERAEDHFRRHEIPRIIQKHGKAYAIEHGFIDIDGNPKK